MNFYKRFPNVKYENIDKDTAHEEDIPQTAGLDLVPYLMNSHNESFSDAYKNFSLYKMINDYFGKTPDSTVGGNIR